MFKDRLARSGQLYRLILPALIAMVYAACASAQVSQTTPQLPTVRVTSRLVVLDVRVMDRQGHLVSGLDSSQFAVYEDNHPEKILHFESMQAKPTTTGPAVGSTPDLLKRDDEPNVNVLVIDELNTPLSEVSRARAALVSYLNQQPVVLPAPTLFVASGATRLAVLHDFTQDRNALLAALNAHVADVDFRALNNQIAGGNMSPADGFAKTLGAISQLASSLRGIHGHKNVLWIGSGFDNAFDLTSAGSNDTESIESALRTVSGRMLDARISLSTLDPAGMDALKAEENVDAEATNGGGGNSLTSFSDGVSFDGLARTTGGTVVHGRNDLSTLVQQNAAAELYVLSYRPSDAPGSAPDYRKIRVAMKDPSLTAITRTGYFPPDNPAGAVTPAEAAQNKRQYNFDLLGAASSRLDYTGLHVTASKGKGGDFLVQVGTSDLTWTPAGPHRTADISVIAVAFDGKDNAIAQDAHDFQEQIKDSDRTFGSYVALTFHLNIPANAERVRFAVRDAGNGSIGSFELAP